MMRTIDINNTLSNTSLDFIELERKIKILDECVTNALGTNYEFRYIQYYIDALKDYIDAKLQISKRGILL